MTSANTISIPFNVSSHMEVKHITKMMECLQAMDDNIHGAKDEILKGKCYRAKTEM